MQTPILVGLLLAVHQAHGHPQPPFISKCMTENGVTGADFKNFAKTGEAADNLKCNFKCIMLAAGVMSEDGKLNSEPMLKHTPEKVHGAIKECCEIETSSDLCDLAYRHNKCLRDKASEWFQEMSEKHHE